MQLDERIRKKNATTAFFMHRENKSVSLLKFWWNMICWEERLLVSLNESLLLDDRNLGKNLNASPIYIFKVIYIYSFTHGCWGLNSSRTSYLN